MVRNNGIESEPELGSEQDLVLRLRRRQLRVSFWALAIVPALSSMVLLIAYQLLYFRAPGWSAPYLLYLLIYQVDDALKSVFLMQILVWWQWKSHAARRWPIGLSLLAVDTIGTLLASRFSDAFQTSQTGFWQMTAVMAVMGWATIAAHYVVLAAAGSFIRFQFSDRSKEVPAELDEHAKMTAAAAADMDLVKREPWSIRGMFIATLVAAVTLACLQWSRSVYATQGDSSWYPTSDAGYVAWIITAALGNVLCLLAAAGHKVGASRWLSITLVVIAAISFISGHLAWTYFLADNEWLIQTSDVVHSTVNAAFMYGMNLWAFRRWSKCGYTLGRSETVR